MKKYARGKNPNSRNNPEFFIKGHKQTYDGTALKRHTKENGVWNKGTKGIMKSNSGSFKIGDKAPKTAFKKGVRPWNYKGLSSLNKSLRSKSMWKIWREAVFLRDNFTCQNKGCKFCNNKIGVMLHPHHKKPLSKFPELVFKVENGITYCAEYHLKSGLHKGIQTKQKIIVSDYH